MKIKTMLYVSGAIFCLFALMLALSLLWVTSRVNEAIGDAERGLELVESATELSLISEEYLDYFYPRMEAQWRSNYLTILALIDEDEAGKFEYLRRDLYSLAEDFNELVVISNRLASDGAAPPNGVDFREILAGQIRISMNRIVTSSLQTQAEIYQEVKQVQEDTVPVAFGVSVLLTAVIALVTSQLIRRISSPLDELITGVNLLGEGDMAYRIQQSGSDELGELTVAFNEMADKRQRSEERYRSLFEHSPISLWEEDYSNAKREIDRLQAEGITDLDTYLRQNKEVLERLIQSVTVLSVNARTVELFAVPDESHLLGPFNLKVEDAYDAFILQFLAIAQGKRKLRFNSRSITLTGETLQVVLNWNVLPGHAHDYSRVIVSVVDITQMWQTEKALENSLNRLQALFNNSQDAILLTNDEAGYVDANPAACEMTGYSLEALRSLHVWDLSSDLDEAGGSQAWAQFLAEGKSEGDFRLRRADGSEIETEFRAVANIVPGLHLSMMRDVTERRRREAAVRTSENKYRNLVETSHDLIWSIDADGRITFMNQAAKRIYGREPEEMIGHSYTDFIPEEQALLNAASWQQAINNEDAFVNYENWVIHKDGTPVLLSANAILLRDADGNIVGSTGTSQDITKRKEMEAALRQRERDLLEAHRITGLGSWQLDIAKNRLTWSDQVYKIFGVEVDAFEATFEAFYNFVHPDDRDVLLRAQQLALSGGSTLSIEHRIVRPDGKVRYVHERAGLVVNDQYEPIKLVGTVHDITIRKEFELKLRETNEQLQAIIQASPVAIIVLQLGGTVELWSPSAEKMFGWSSEEILGKPYPLAQSELLHDEFLANLQLIKNGQSLDNLETWRQTKVGDLIAVSMEVVPILGPDGLPAAALIMTTEITERKQAEAQLQEYARRLEALHRIDQAILMEEYPEDIAQTAVEHLAGMIEYDRITVAWLDEDQGQVKILAAMHKVGSVVKQGDILTIAIDPSVGNPLTQGRLAHIQNLEIFRGVSPFIDQLLAEGLKSYLVVPLIASGRFLGGIAIGSCGPATIDARQEMFVKEVADQIAIALQQSSLFEREKNQRKLVEALRDTAVSLTLANSTEEIYRAVMTNAGRICPHDLQAVIRLEDSAAHVAFVDGKLPPEVKQEMLQAVLPAELHQKLSQLLADGETIILSDAEAVRRLIPVDALLWIRSAIIVPILLQPNKLVGAVALASAQPDSFETSMVKKLSGFAEQMALGLERLSLTEALQAYASELETRVAERTAELEDQFRQQAAYEERQRLARELHDVVSQSLFSAKLIAETLPRLLHNKPEDLTQGLNQLQYLTRGALAEMRTLLLELRPNKLGETSLGDLLQYQTDSLGGRLGISLDVSIQDEQALPEEVQHAFYRIIQEALNNIARHARATAVTVHLSNLKSSTRLFIQDNGIGFDESLIPPDHLGLGIMKERAHNIGAKLKISSAPGAGTTLELVWINKQG